MNALNAITIAGIEIPGWTLEIALFWLLFAIVVITVFMVIVFAVLMHRVGKNNTVVVDNNAVIVSNNAEEELEKVDYVITVTAPEELETLQVALYNGGVQVGSAANVVDGAATIAAPASDYTVKVFGLPDDDYVVNAELLSAEKRVASVKVDYCEDYYEEGKNDDEADDEEMIDYVINVVAPEELNSLQVALYNGSEQIEDAVNVENRKAIITAPAGDYYVKVFCLPDDDYVVSVDLLSAEKKEATVTITYCEDYEDNDNGYEEEKEVPTVSELIDFVPELVEYHVAVTAPDELPTLQIALFNGDIQVGNAANIESGTATLTAEEGDYTLKLFGLPEGYEVNAGTLSATRHFATVTITATAKEEIAVAEASERDPWIIEEESFDGGILRYDRSFKARYIQSDNEIKGWYTELKNELLSYKKVHDRLSWKRESYNFGRNPVARLAFRGNTLCLYLPLDPAEYADSKYKVEGVEDSTTYADTPCLYRIKNDRRAKYAKELIAIVTEKLGAVRIDRDSVDYYEPYEGLVQLINKGLIKRNIKNKSAEAFFIEKKDNNNF